MSVLASSRAAEKPASPRRLNPSTDLSAVADLIEEAFSEDLDQEGRQVLKELRQLSNWGVLLWLLRATSPAFEDILSGFVWEEDGHIVGNVSANVTAHVLSQWRVSNVAILPAYRRRGIARHLMEMTIAHIDRKGGRKVYLQVRDENGPALRLYKDLDFQSVTAETEMYLPAGSATAPPLDDFQPRPLRREESSQVYSLALAATSQADQRQTPPNRSDFEVDWIQQLSDSLTAFTSGRRTYRFVVEGKSELAAYAKLTTARHGGSAHRLSLLVRPDCQGTVESALIRTVLSTVTQHQGPAEIQIRLNAGKKGEIAALSALGFVKRRTLITMELRLD